ncbi:MAG: hypothetical protein OEV89_12745 [Desulfobulbaceae bacterium]|nr:hypothetical protein [Desulfobulbaceae bacterium]HIJ91527.1 hypothetical protein [Deltaproteobacteria bacterium]
MILDALPFPPASFLDSCAIFATASLLFRLSRTRLPPTTSTHLSKTPDNFSEFLREQQIVVTISNHIPLFDSFPVFFMKKPEDTS